VEDAPSDALAAASKRAKRGGGAPILSFGEEDDE
jgi:hypothetical protein